MKLAAKCLGRILSALLCIIAIGTLQPAFGSKIELYFDTDGSRLVWFMPQGTPIAPTSAISVGGTTMELDLPKNLGNFAKIAVEDASTGNAAVFIWTPTTNSINISQTAFTYAGEVEVHVPQAVGSKATMSAPSYSEVSQVDQDGVAHFYCVPIGPVRVVVSDINGPVFQDGFTIAENRPQAKAILDASAGKRQPKEEIWRLVTVLVVFSLGAAGVAYWRVLRKPKKAL